MDSRSNIISSDDDNNISDTIQNNNFKNTFSSKVNNNESKSNFSSKLNVNNINSIVNINNEIADNNNSNLNSIKPITKKKNNIYQTTAKPSRDSSRELQTTRHPSSFIGINATEQKVFSGTNKILDLRPIKTQNFQYECMTRIFNTYIALQGQDASHFKELMVPDSRRFVNIFKFFMKFILANYVVQIEKLDVDVPIILRDIKYPGNLNKTVFLSVGAPGAWPNLLALLAWVADLAIYMDTFRIQIERYFKDLNNIPNNLKNEKLISFCEIIKLLVSSSLAEKNKTEKESVILQKSSNRSQDKIGENLNELNFETHLDNNSNNNIIANKFHKSYEQIELEEYLNRLNFNSNNIYVMDFNNLKHDLYGMKETNFQDLINIVEEAKNEAKINILEVNKFHDLLSWDFLKASYVEFSKTNTTENSFNEYREKFNPIEVFYNNNLKMLTEIEELINKLFAFYKEVESELKRAEKEAKESRDLAVEAERKFLEQEKNIEELTKKIEERKKIKNEKKENLNKLKIKNAELKARVESQTMTREEYDAIQKRIKQLDEDSIRKEKERKEISEKTKNLDLEHEKMVNDLMESFRIQKNDFEKYGIDKDYLIDYPRFIKAYQDIHNLHVQIINNKFNKNIIYNFDNQQESDIEKKYKELKISFENEYADKKMFFQELIKSQQKQIKEFDESTQKINTEILRQEDRIEQKEIMKNQAEEQIKELNSEILNLKEQQKREREIYSGKIKVSEENLKDLKISYEIRLKHLKQVEDQRDQILMIIEKKSDELLEKLEKAQIVHEDLVLTAYATKKENIKSLKIAKKKREKLLAYLKEDLEREKNENSDELEDIDDEEDGQEGNQKLIL